MEEKKFTFRKISKASIPLSYMFFEKLNLSPAPKYQKFHHSKKVNTSEMPIYPYYKPISQIF
jgi:hypothetical protein